MKPGPLPYIADPVRFVLSASGHRSSSEPESGKWGSVTILQNPTLSDIGATPKRPFTITEADVARDKAGFPACLSYQDARAWSMASLGQRQSPTRERLKSHPEDCSR